MTREEFQTWLDEFGAAFPQTAKWISELPARKATLGLWYETTFVNLELCDCQAVTRRMLKGEDEPGEAYERDQLPQLIAGYAAHARNRRLTTKANFVPEYVEAAQGKKKFDVLGICSKIKSAMAGGMSAEQACSVHLPQTDPEDCPRYKCLQCRDVGMVSVWHPTAMYAAKHGTFDKRRHCSVCKIRCNCSAGGKWPSFPQIFASRKWLAVENYTRQSEIDKLHEFMGSYGVTVSTVDEFVWQGEEF